MRVTKKDTIFVQIASYRDPELNNTLEYLFKNAKYPDNLRVCIAWQHSDEDEWDNLDKWKKDKRVKILDIPHVDSNGVCWARNQIQQHYNKEKYTLQLDSHHYFSPDWDFKLLEMFDVLLKDGIKKPLITGYIPHFNPKDPGTRETTPWWMCFDRFAPEGPIHTIPHGLDDYKFRNKPVPARFYSAHFAFTWGKFAKEVQHDPTMYFHGEEPSISIRAYTHGYDLFHPHRIYWWHEYTRDGKPHHWEDHDFGDYDRNSFLRYRKLLSMDGEKYDPKEFGKYGLGKERKLSEWIRFSGINPSKRILQRLTYDRAIHPPNPDYATPSQYENSFVKIFRHCIDVHEDDLSVDDIDFIVVAFKLEDGTEIHREDTQPEELVEIFRQKKDDGWLKIWRDFELGMDEELPTKYLVWPHSETKGWGEPIERDLPK